MSKALKEYLKIKLLCKKLDYLVIGINPTNRKVIQAKELNVKVIDQKEWQKMLN